MSERIDRILLSFYGDDEKELLLLNCINKMATKRNRANKIKDILLDYIKETEPDLYEQFKNNPVKIDKEQKQQAKVISDKIIDNNDKVKELENEWEVM